MKWKDTVWELLRRYYASFGLDLKKDWFARATLWLTLITGVILAIVLFVL